VKAKRRESARGDQRVMKAKEIFTKSMKKLIQERKTRWATMKENVEEKKTQKPSKKKGTVKKTGNPCKTLGNLGRNPKGIIASNQRKGEGGGKTIAKGHKHGALREQQESRQQCATSYS